MISYFEYILEKCDDEDIASVCDLFSTKASLLEATKKWGGGVNILGLYRLVSYVQPFLLDNAMVTWDYMSTDVRKLYDTFISSICEMEDFCKKHKDVDYEHLFNTLVDVNWYLSSVYKSFTGNSHGKYALLESHEICINWLKKALEDLAYESAVYSKKLGEDFREADKFWYILFSGLIPSPKVREYLKLGICTTSDFGRMEKQFREESCNDMALFMALTVTAAREEHIRRTM